MTAETTRPSATPRWRLFVALPVPDDAASAIAESLAAYRARFPDARWLRPAMLHVTVRFLGGVRPDAVPGLIQALTAAATNAGPIELATDRGAGDARGRSGSPGVAWLTLGTGPAAVRVLCDGLDPLLPLEALASPDLRPPPDAHVTVARRATVGLIGALRDQALGPTRVSWSADRVVLFRSHTGTPRGSAYEPLAEVRLEALAAA